MSQDRECVELASGRRQKKLADMLVDLRKARQKLDIIDMRETLARMERGLFLLQRKCRGSNCTDGVVQTGYVIKSHGMRRASAAATKEPVGGPFVAWVYDAGHDVFIKAGQGRTQAAAQEQARRRLPGARVRQVLPIGMQPR